MLLAFLFRYGTFYGNRTTRGGGAHRVLIKPSLDDPWTALCIIDRAPKPRAADGKLSDLKFQNEVGGPIVRIGCREFKCIGAYNLLTGGASHAGGKRFSSFWAA